MGGPAEQDKGGEQPEQRPEHEVAAAVGDDAERQGDAEIGESDADVGDGIGPDESRIPEQTKTMRG